MAVHLSPEGRVFQANSRYRPGIKVDMKPRLSPPEAIVAARENLKPSEEVLTEPTAELVIYPGVEEARLAYRVLYPAAEPLGSWEYLIDARDGSVLSCRNQYCFVDGSGRVFEPSPVVVLHDNSLTDQNNTDAAVPEIAYATVTLQGLDGTGVLRGEFADVITKSAGRATDAGYKFFYTRSSRRFEEVMLYYHVDAMQRYVQSLGFTDANNEPQRVYADSHPGFPDPWVYDQSLYVPGDDYVAFGIGGVDDAEDAEIIAHEYGHAIQHDQVPGFPAGGMGEGAAVGEGWGDYWAADYCARMSGGWQDIYLGEWDATSYRTGDPPYYLRRLDNIHHYPDDFTGDAYNGGEIWSSALWAIRARIGSATATTIALQSHFLLDSSAKFGKAVNAFLDAEEALYGEVYRSAIIKEFQLRGFWPYEVELSGFDLSFDVPVVIPDYTVEGVESTLTVDSSDVVSDSDPLLVYIDLQHDAVKDLRIRLRSPAGTEVILHDRTGGDLEDFEFVYGESRIPRESLSKFDGESIEGTWTLQITDRSSAHGGGVLNGWGLSCPRRPATGIEDWDAMD
jgi:subtilisin-like proprotein convertase family protein